MKKKNGVLISRKKKFDFSSCFLKIIEKSVYLTGKKNSVRIQSFLNLSFASSFGTQTSSYFKPGKRR